MKSTYRQEDVTILLKDITGMVQPQPTEERERLIQSGKHYSEMLPIEYSPSPQYMDAYQSALRNYSKVTADAVGVVAQKIIEQKGKQVVLVSLARAGTPIGILIKRYIRRKYGIDVPHYTISIIRGRGIDQNAMKEILRHHEPEQIQFVDGWIGKGAILHELEKELKQYPNVSSELAVLSDPANLTKLCGTHEDILIPSSCLNCTVSGLISRTFLRKDIIGANDYHGAVYYEELEPYDLSLEFIQAIEKEFSLEDGNLEYQTEKECRALEYSIRQTKGIEEVLQIAKDYSIQDINLIKPGIGEATRVLLRRVPWKVLIQSGASNSTMLEHLLRLAQEKGVVIEEYPLKHYKACGIIKKCTDI